MRLSLYRAFGLNVNVTNGEHRLPACTENHVARDLVDDGSMNRSSSVFDGLHWPPLTGSDTIPRVIKPDSRKILLP
jgi:hypothetical protein